MSANEIRKIIEQLESMNLDESIIKTVLDEYTLDELFTFDNVITEDMENLQPFQTGIWNVDYSNAFKKGMKKQRNNPKVKEELQVLENWILSHNSKPEKSTFPPKFNVHIINTDPTFSGAYDAHIIGSRIIALFYIENEKENLKLRWVHIGSHKDASRHLG